MRQRSNISARDSEPVVVDFNDWAASQDHDAQEGQPVDSVRVVRIAEAHTEETSTDRPSIQVNDADHQVDSADDPMPHRFSMAAANAPE